MKVIRRPVLQRKDERGIVVWALAVPAIVLTDEGKNVLVSDEVADAVERGDAEVRANVERAA